jgi:hypothetical protein
LSLTKGNGHNSNIDFISETLELFGGVDTRSHDKDDRRSSVRLFVDLLHGGGLGAGEFGSLKVGVHEVDNRESDSIGSEASEDDHLFHVIITLALPLSGKLSLLRIGFGRREPAVPLFCVELDSRCKSLVKVNLLLKLTAVIPSSVSNPIRVWRLDGLACSIEDCTSS